MQEHLRERRRDAERTPERARHQRIGAPHGLAPDALERRPRGALHASAEYLALVARLGATAVSVPDLAPSEAARESARRLAGAERWIVIRPGAIYGASKCLPPARSAGGARARAANGGRALVVGSGGGGALELRSGA